MGSSLTLPEWVLIRRLRRSEIEIDTSPSPRRCPAAIAAPPPLRVSPPGSLSRWAAWRVPRAQRARASGKLSLWTLGIRCIQELQKQKLHYEANSKAIYISLKLIPLTNYAHCLLCTLATHHTTVDMSNSGKGKSPWTSILSNRFSHSLVEFPPVSKRLKSAEVLPESLAMPRNRMPRIHVSISLLASSRASGG